MIINLVPVEVIFDKVVTDLNITEHDVDVAAFKQWTMEAMEHIGGMNRIEAIHKLLPEGATVGSALVDHTLTFPQGVLDISEVRYYKDATVKRDDYTLCFPANGANMDDTSDTILFDRVFTYPSARERSTMALKFNRKDGIVQCLGCKIPVFNVTIPGGTTTTQMFVPAIASYQEAIYWYICMKMLWRDVFRGRNKGN